MIGCSCINMFPYLSVCISVCLCFRHKVEIEEICRNASREQELEIKMRITEEEWTEQVK